MALNVHLLSRMVHEGSAPSARIFLATLRALTVAELGNDKLAAGKELHGLASKCGYDSDIYVQSTLIDMYAKCGIMEEARTVFEGIKKPNVVSWTALVSGYTDNGESIIALEMFARLRNEGCVPNARTFVAIIKACTDLVVKEDDSRVKASYRERGKVLHLLASRSGIDHDIYVQCILVEMHAKCLRLEDAQKVFDSIRQPDLVSYSALISGYVYNKEPQLALDLFWRMRDEGFVQDPRTFIIALKACIELSEKNDQESSREKGRQLHRLASKTGCDSDSYVQTTLVDMYAKCGSMEESRRVFDNMKYPTTVSWTALIFGYAENGEGGISLDMFSRMRREDCPADGRTFVAALKGCTDLAEKEQSSDNLTRGVALHMLVSRNGHDADKYVHGTLVDMYAKCGSMRDAHIVFDSMNYRSLVAWNALISGYAANGEGRIALVLFSRMNSECAPDSRTFVATLKACTEEDVVSMETGKVLHLLTSTLSYDFEVYLQTSLVDMYAKCGSMQDARRVFDSMSCPNLASWNALMSGYTENDQGNTVLDLFSRLRDANIAPDARAFVTALKACSILADKEDGAFKVASRERGRQLHLLASMTGHDSDIYVQCILVDMYANCHSMDEARGVFDSIKHPDVVSYSAMMFGYAENGEGAAVLSLFSRMTSQGCAPNARAYVAALNACCMLGASEFGKALHSEMCKREFTVDGILANSLVNFYAKCGNLIEAEQLFNLHSSKSLAAWNALMEGYSRHGITKNVFHLFDRMCDAGLEPNDTTFVCLFTACSHAGLVERGKNYFDIMCTKFRISPSIDHYTCMLDLLGRANKLEDSMTLLRNMPFTPDNVMWLTILGACRKNVQLGRLAFDTLTSLDDKDSAAYIMMRNVY